MAFQGTSLPLPLFHFISRRELVLRFKEVKGELKRSKSHRGTSEKRSSFQLRSVTPLWSAGHPAGCVSRLLLSPQLVPAPQEAARLPRLSSEQGMVLQPGCLPVAPGDGRSLSDGSCSYLDTRAQVWAHTSTREPPCKHW